MEMTKRILLEDNVWQEEQKKCCKYCMSDHNYLEYAMHRLTNSHVKKVKNTLLQHEFDAVCLICIVGLKGLKDVEKHIGGEMHANNIVASHRDNRIVTKNKEVCGMCGVAFHNQVALGAHHLMASHSDTTTSISASGKLSELLQELSGRSGVSIINSLVCTICDVQHDNMEACIMHMFTKAHLHRLRLTTCIICKKEFVHIGNTEDHLTGIKHQSLLRRYTGKLTEQMQKHILMVKGVGYPCMFCMVWCSSLLSLDLHLQGGSHMSASNRKQVGFQQIKFIACRSSSSEHCQNDICEPSGDCHNDICDPILEEQWKKWREDASQEQQVVWCHRCGALLPSLEAANQHGEDHDPQGINSSLAHPSHTAMHIFHNEAPPLCGHFSCSLCALCFKSVHLLTAHESSFEHHNRMSRYFSSDERVCCADCGVFVNTRNADKFIRREGIEALPLHLEGEAGTRFEVEPDYCSNDEGFAKTPRVYGGLRPNLAKLPIIESSSAFGKVKNFENSLHAVIMTSITEALTSTLPFYMQPFVRTSLNLKSKRRKNVNYGGIEHVADQPYAKKVFRSSRAFKEENCHATTKLDNDKRGCAPSRALKDDYGNATAKFNNGVKYDAIEPMPPHGLDLTDMPSVALPIENEDEEDYGFPYQLKDSDMWWLLEEDQSDDVGKI